MSADECFFRDVVSLVYHAPEHDNATPPESGEPSEYEKQIQRAVDEVLDVKKSNSAALQKTIEGCVKRVKNCLGGDVFIKLRDEYQKKDNSDHDASPDPGEFDALPDLVKFLECLHAVSAKWEAAVFAANPQWDVCGFQDFEYACLMIHEAPFLKNKDKDTKDNLIWKMKNFLQRQANGTAERVDEQSKADLKNEAANKETTILKIEVKTLFEAKHNTELAYEEAQILCEQHVHQALTTPLSQALLERQKARKAHDEANRLWESKQEQLETSESALTSCQKAWAMAILYYMLCYPTDGGGSGIIDVVRKYLPLTDAQRSGLECVQKAITESRFRQGAPLERTMMPGNRTHGADSPVAKHVEKQGWQSNDFFY
jgi:hypothetical protein